MIVQVQKAQENTSVEALKSYQTLFINASSVVSKLKVKTPCTEHRHLSLMPRVPHCALQLQDKPLLAKLSAGDMAAQDAEYHVKCLVSLYNRARGTETYSAESDANAVNHGHCFC